MSHKCPAPGCELQVKGSMLACRTHWYSLPKDLQRRIWRAWDRGAGAGSQDHLEIINEAVRFLAGR